MKISLDTHICCPRQSHEIERNGESVFFSPETRVGVRVNRFGAGVLRTLKPDDTPLDIAKRLSIGRRFPDTKKARELCMFLESLVSAGYLTLEGEKVIDNSSDKYDTSFRPNQVYLHLTHVCNLSCVYCYNSQYRQEARQPELSMDEFKNLLRELYRIGAREVIFTGGEPLLRSEVIDLAGFCQGLGMRVCIITNGTLITENYPELMVDVFDLIFVSLDSCDMNQNDILRGEGTYQKVIDGLHALCRKKPECVCLKPVITSRNLKSLPQLAPWAVSEFGIKKIIPSWYLPNSLSEIDELGLFVDDQSRGCYEDFVAECKTAGIANILECLPFRTRGKCGAGSQIMSIDATGEVFPCQALHFPELSGGNIRQMSLEETGRAHSMRCAAEISVASVSHCSDCGISSVCGGGCRALAYTLYRDLYAYNQFLCPVLRQDAEDRLWAQSEKSIANS